MVRNLFSGDGFLSSPRAVQVLYNPKGLLLSGITVAPRASVSGLYQVTALVPDAGMRLATSVFMLFFALPLLLGLGYAMLKRVRLVRAYDGYEV